MTTPPGIFDSRLLSIHDLEALYSRWIASGEQLHALLGQGPINTWDHALLEFSAYKSRRSDWARGAASNIELLVQAGESGPSAMGAQLAPPDTPRSRSVKLLRLAHARKHAGDLAGALSLVERAVEADPSTASARHWLLDFRAQAAAQPELAPKVPAARPN